MEHSAKDAISGLLLTAANYDEAIDVLKTRFGAKQRIISKHNYEDFVGCQISVF